MWAAAVRLCMHVCLACCGSVLPVERCPSVGMSSSKNTERLTLSINIRGVQLKLLKLDRVALRVVLPCVYCTKGPLAWQCCCKPHNVPKQFI